MEARQASSIHLELTAAAVAAITLQATVVKKEALPNAFNEIR